MVWDISATEVEFISKYRKDNHWLKSQSLGPFLSTLTGIKSTCLSTLAGTRRNESEGAGVEGSTTLQSASRLQSKEVIHVLKLEDLVAPTHPTWL